MQKSLNCRRPLHGDDLDGFRRSLLIWYRTHQRDLPWRRSDDPYSVWISEMMLQQTQVGQARPYYERFMARFPDVVTLAGASQDAVLKAWEGLGYYARARNLHKAAKLIVADHGAAVPDDFETITDLPGIGPYAAAAILSIAYGKPHAAVDGNVVRVISRLSNYHDDVTRGPAKKELQALADRLLASECASDFNQAMMELGAMICLPRQPMCEFCPVHDHCRASVELEDPSILPRRPVRGSLPHYDLVAGLVLVNGRMLIVQRPDEGLLGGLWEFPSGRVSVDESYDSGVTRVIQETTGLVICTIRPLPPVAHAFTHFKITIHGFVCQSVSGIATKHDWKAIRWVQRTGLARYAFSKAHRRLLDAFGPMNSSENTAVCGDMDHTEL